MFGGNKKLNKNLTLQLQKNTYTLQMVTLLQSPTPFLMLWNLMHQSWKGNLKNFIIK